MKNNWQKNKLSFFLILLLVLFFILNNNGLLVSFLTNNFFQALYPSLLATFIGVLLGIPAGLYINREVEKKKDRRNVASILIFIKTELTGNFKNVENLQSAAESIISLKNNDKRDLKILGKFTRILK